MSLYTAEKILSVNNVLGESPVWEPTSSCLFWLDILSNILYKFNPADKDLQQWSLPFVAGAVLTSYDPHIVLLVSDIGIVRFNLHTTHYTILCAYPENKALSRPNEAKVDPYGNIIFGTIGYDPKNTLGNIYCFNENGLRKVYQDIHIINTFIWQVVSVKTDQLILQYRRRDGSGGFPGNVEIKVTFHLSAANELLINYHASTDKVTPLDITNHTYWNLSGSGTILDDEAQFNADYYLPTDTDFLPTGKIESVKHTYFDFHEPRSLAEDIKFLTAAKGYNHYFILKQKKTGLNLAATIKDPNSRRILQVSTTQPGFQFYTGNFLQGDYAPYSGFAIETQAYPNAVSKTAFPSIFLPPEQIYQHRTCYKITDY